MKRIVILSLVVVLLATLLPLTTAAATTYGTVTGGWLRLRSSASFDATIIKSYYTGTVVEILGTSGSWYHVETPDSRTGYMYSSYISLGGGGSTGYTAYVTSSNGYGVRMRTGPSKGYRVIAVYPVGTTVTVLSTGILWSRIQVGTTVGYMMSEFLTTTSPGTPTTTPTGDDMATVWSSNGYGVRLRSGAGTGYSIIGLYSVGTRVDVITRGTTWDYIQVGSRLGYMMNEFLIYDHSSTTPVATSITLTADTASGGQGDLVDLDVTVTGTSLSSPAYTLAVTGNSSMAEIQDGQLYIYGSATIGAEIEVTATTTDNDSDGNPITDTCTVIVIEGSVSSFSFNRSEAEISIAGATAQIQIGYTISGPPYITLSIPLSVRDYVTTAVDATNKRITVSVLSTIPSGTEFVITGTTNADGSSGAPLTDTVTISVVSDATLSSITLVPVSTSLAQGETTDINATLTYTNGTIVENADISKYSLAITSGSDYASLSGKTLTAGSFSSLNDQTITVQGTSAEDSTKTDTCDIVIAASVVPTAPTLISVIPGNAQVRLTWSAPSGSTTITGYEAYYSTAYDGTKTRIDDAMLSSATREVTATGLTNGTTYYFWVRAWNATGASEYSNYLTATPAVAVPDAPTNLAVDSYAAQSVTISWTAPSYNGGAEVTNYLVYVDGTLAEAAASALTQRTLTGLENGHTYSITIRAHNAAGDGTYSTALSVTLPNVPDAPVITSCQPGDRKITVSWSTPALNGSTIDYYALRYWTDPTSKTTVAPAGNPCTISGLTNGETYYAEVVASSNMGFSNASDTQNCTLPLATAITAADASGAPDETLTIDVTVSGTNISTPAYTLSLLSGNGEIVNNQLHILATASDGDSISVRATSVDPDAAGSSITDDCTVTVSVPALAPAAAPDEAEAELELELIP